MPLREIREMALNEQSFIMGSYFYLIMCVMHEQ